jgi:hypothetical protein
LHHFTSIFLTLLNFLTRENFAEAKNHISSAAIGVLCASESQEEFLTTDRTDSTDEIELERQVATNANVLNTSLGILLRGSISIHSFLILATFAPCIAVQKEFLTTDSTDSTDKSDLNRQATKSAKVFRTSSGILNEVRVYGITNGLHIVDPFILTHR